MSNGILLWLLTSDSFGYSFAGGTGEPGDPYQVATAEQLISIGSDPNLLTRHFVLVNDIDLNPSPKPFGTAAIAPAWGSGEEVHGSPFAGLFDGHGHTISHLTSRGGKYLGLFGRLAQGAEVRDLGVVDVNITGSGAVGGLVGDSGGAVTGCFSTGSVSATGDNVGGLVGCNSGPVTHCYSTSTVTVSGRDAVGGLVGTNSGSVSYCCSTGAVRGNPGDVFGSHDVGGLVGLSSGRITNCYSTGGVWGYQRVGGLVGTNGGSVTSCYSIGTVRRTSGDVIGSHDVGGLAGNNSGTMTGCFWDIQTSGRSTSAGGTGLTIAQMQDIQTYLDAGWDFVDEVENGTSQVWQMPRGGGYPVLAIFGGYTPQLRGLGTPEDPYLVSDALELGAMVYYSPHAHYRLAASIDLAGIRWATAVVPWFAGVFDGNDLAISHLTIKGGSSLGLFGELASAAEVKDLGVVDVNIASSDSYVGGLAGTNSGAVTRCYSTGAVSGAGQDVGGLVGNNGGTLTQCTTAGSVHCTGGARFGSGLGGLAGCSSGDVTWCTSTAAVFGCEDVGGLVGTNTGTVRFCYSTGVVSGGLSVGGLVGWNSGDVARCFWDTQTSGQAQSAGGTGLTTARMQDIQTFLTAGWGFVGEIQNGTHQVWQMPQGGGYPVLAILSGYTPAQLQGLGTSEDPYLIFNAEDLGAMIHYGPSAHYRLAASIDLAGIRWGTAVVPRFGGTFDGSHLTISHLTIAGDEYLGLFGQLAPGAEVKDLGIVDANIVGSGDFVGSLVGSSEGAVTQCTSTGTVSGGASVGGLVGTNRGAMIACGSAGAANGNDCVGGLVGENDYGQVTRSTSTGEVNGMRYVGGLVGTSRGEVTQCYSTAAVIGTGLNVAGLVGWNSGTVTQCYSVGAVTGGPWNHGGLVVGDSARSVNGCFWDTQTSGQARSDGGSGKTTAQMQTATPFVNAGWDFVETWMICEGRDYPRLRWEGRTCGDKPAYFTGFWVLSAEPMNRMRLVTGERASVSRQSVYERGMLAGCKAAGPVCPEAY